MNISGFFLCFYGGQGRRNKDEGERDENQCFFLFLEWAGMKKQE